MTEEEGSDGKLDLSQFYDVFFDEAAEHLANMESLLLGIDPAAADEEQLNAIFRAAHSIKGGAATFGFEDITELTHEMETVFDRVRKGNIALSTELIDTFLASGDMLNSMLASRRGDGEEMPEDSVSTLCTRLRAFLDGSPSKKAANPAATTNTDKKTNTDNEFEILFGPFDEKFSRTSVDAVVGDLKEFGAVEEITASEMESQDENGKDSASGLRRFHIITDVDISELSEVVAFMANPERVKVTSRATTNPSSQAADDAGFGLFDDGTPSPVKQSAEKGVDAKAVKQASDAKPAAGQSSNDTASIRVSVQKVDQLINLVGELVITQAMLTQTASKSDPLLYEGLFNSLAQLERSTRDLQEAAMSIRMMPMSFAFSRFPRVVRDVAAKLGKEVDLHTIGEATELDKGLIERIVDPLTHLVRNSLDHGLESPEEREAKGKVRKGTITLHAYHQGGSIVIDVNDDGRGLRRDKILAKAQERGIHTSDSMSDQEVWQLIFEAGFSTADQVSDVSGRGVGMDVVRRNIQQMGGRVEIESAADIGTRISIRLPLTLAILDGMSVRLGQDVFILPLGYISESLQPKPGSVSTIGGSRQVISVRGEYVPVVRLAEIYGLCGDKRDFEEGIIVILEVEGSKSKTALFVDDLIGQHQVVIKSLESNYRKVDGISGATIMGDGRVAMIIDVPHIVGFTHSQQEKAA